MENAAHTRERPETWPDGLVPYWLDAGQVVDVEDDRDERPGHDSLGNAGHVLRARQRGRIVLPWSRSRVVERLESAGLARQRDVQGESELARAPRDVAIVDVDPFLLEDSVRAVVRGRDFPGNQREMLEKKVAALRAEVQAAGTTTARRDEAAAMLASLEEGLQASVDVRAVTRRFRPVIQVAEPRASLGDVVPLVVGSRVVYRVASVVPEAPDEDGDGTMIFHVVALGAHDVVVLYTGGVHGMRHLADLEGSRVHNAWFANRERTRTDSTAPWLGRRVLNELEEYGASELVVHMRRDPEPVAIEKTGEDAVPLVVGESEIEVPVVLARTSKADELTILRDVANPLVLRLKEAGAELVRTVERVLPPLPRHGLV